ncbi:6-hydroxymethylpterin diphosphokinase MptE-like protein [Solidesulfovibrio carbinolicus]|uniref:6-hydroxymethylpterin diphosphokinase MptE-like domain-containing protein n=1 Tax=Solidesulfovibrio carbinolicus TaxID=296842 RepID=A0A4P6HVU0_9BACT|nr:6-hydroxymethylpterin diphosphokinase MptE-like protein [Solidesulfovibrio carbinolicus]QAZ69648.1 hypothetical protein C3Y92_20470 [Solidesulfovibrio carbinolicus]
MFRTVLADTPLGDDGSLFIFLGAPAAAGIKRKLAFPAVNEAVLQGVTALPVQALLDGVTVVIDAAAYARDKVWIDAVQKQLAMVYCKHVLFPRQSGTIPDVAGARQEEGYLLLQREIQRAENVALYLQSPLCNRLRGLGRGLATAVLLPGPSLNKVAPLLPELREKCLIVCVPRTVAFCLQAGVEPDFVVSLDTAARMQHLVRPSRPLPETYLVALSPGALARPVRRYRGLFLMDSFDTSILPNPYRLRESWLSCAISTLGLAELLGAGVVFLAGGDHSWEDPDSLSTYWNTIPSAPFKGNDTAFRPHDGPAMVRDLEQWAPIDVPEGAHMQAPASGPTPVGLPDLYARFPLRDRNGNMVFTYFHYFAISAELEQVAREMAQVGIRCHLLEERGILSPEVFRPGGRDLLATFPPIDRPAFLARADAAHSRREAVRHAQYARELEATANNVSKQAAYLTLRLLDGEVTEARQHPYVQAIEQASIQRKMPAVRDYAFRVKFDCDYAFYVHQLRSLVIDSREFPPLKDTFYQQRIRQCQERVTPENFEQVRKELFPQEEALAVQTTALACRTWAARLEEGAALCRVYQAAAAGEVVVLWCLPEEKADCFKAVRQAVGAFRPHFATLTMQEELASASKTIEYVYFEHFLLYAHACPHAQVTSRGFAREYGNLLELADRKRLVPMHVLECRFLPGEDKCPRA